MSRDLQRSFLLSCSVIAADTGDTCTSSCGKGRQNFESLCWSKAGPVCVGVYWSKKWWFQHTQMYPHVKLNYCGWMWLTTAQFESLHSKPTLENVYRKLLLDSLNYQLLFWVIYGSRLVILSTPTKCIIVHLKDHSDLHIFRSQFALLSTGRIN